MLQVHQALTEKKNRCKIEEATHDIIQAQLKMASAEAFVNNDMVKATSSTIVSMILRNIFEIKDVKSMSYLGNAIYIHFSKLPLTDKECDETFMQKLQSETGFVEIAKNWRCTCCYTDEGHQPDCGIHLVVKW